VKYGRLSTYALVAIVFAVSPFASVNAADPAVERGKYLVTIGGCNGCHTPGYFLGKLDMSRQLGGSEVGFDVPNLGVFYGPNLTMDKDTGLGGWTGEQIVTALTTGVRPDGRKLAPIMPWQAFAVLTKADASAVVAYLRSLPPVRNKVPGPFGPVEAPTSFVMKIVPPDAPDAHAADVGVTLAEAWCAGCHIIKRTPHTEAADGVPSFTAIAARSNTTAASLDHFLSSGHTRMPNFSLSRIERIWLTAYILSLH
jgi:mono/diheme cytochrome c family protein